MKGFKAFKKCINSKIKEQTDVEAKFLSDIGVTPEGKGFAESIKSAKKKGTPLPQQTQKDLEKMTQLLKSPKAFNRAIKEGFFDKFLSNPNKK